MNYQENLSPGANAFNICIYTFLRLLSSNVINFSIPFERGKMHGQSLYSYINNGRVRIKVKSPDVSLLIVLFTLI